MALRQRLLARASSFSFLFNGDVPRSPSDRIRQIDSCDKRRVSPRCTTATLLILRRLSFMVLAIFLMFVLYSTTSTSRRRGREILSKVEEAVNAAKILSERPRLSVADYPVVLVADSPAFERHHYSAELNSKGQVPNPETKAVPGPGSDAQSQQSRPSSLEVQVRHAPEAAQPHGNAETGLGSMNLSAGNDSHLIGIRHSEKNISAHSNAVHREDQAEISLEEDWKRPPRMIARDRVPTTKELSIPEKVDPQAEPLQRIIVITMNRAHSLKRLLVSLKNADYDGDRVDLDIWIDRSKDPAEAEKTTEVMKAVTREVHWPYGVRTIHCRERNAGLYEQWIYTWNITDESAEAAVILEDDLEVSPYFYIWLKQARARYAQDPTVAAFSLQRAELRPRHRKGLPSKLQVPTNCTVYKYKLLGTWGFAPQKAAWLEFRAWMDEMIQLGAKPYVEDLVTTDWYKSQEAKAGLNYAPAMWSQWFIKFSDVKHYYTVYANLQDATTLASNWREKGLHYSARLIAQSVDFPLFRGPPSSFVFPDRLTNLDWDGTEVQPEDFVAQVGESAADATADKNA